MVFANARGQKRDARERNTYKPALARQARAEAIAANNKPELEYTDSPRRESDIIDHITDSPDQSDQSSETTDDLSPSPDSSKDE